jgi:hypothetical protein
MEVNKKLEGMEKRIKNLENRFAKFECDLDSGCPFAEDIQLIKQEMYHYKEDF